MLHVRRVRIIVPLSTSRIRFDAPYVAPLLEARYRPVMPDMAQKVEVADIPENLRTPANVWRVFSSVDEEIGRLRDEFKDVTDSYGRPMFEAIYPGEELRKIILREVEIAEAEMERTADVMLVPPEIVDMKVPGLSDEAKRVMVAHGYNNLGQIAGTLPEKLAALPNINLRLAARIVDAATKAYKPIVPTSAADSGINVAAPSPTPRAVPLGATYSKRTDKPAANALT